MAQAILDGVQVINFSISGGTDPFSDPVELAFLDAYAAGVFVSASAGNDGPGADTVNHRRPVGDHRGGLHPERDLPVHAHPDRRGATETLTGASITAGRRAAPVVLASAPPYYNALCCPGPAGHLHRQDRRL